MNAAETALWDNIRKFQFDDAGVSFKFSDRLARENGWSIQYTQRVITEYRKFIFLCCVSNDGVTPSDPVDQAWHLHLTYTRSYWIDLCQDTLGRQIHHNPTKGGTSETQKFKGYYKSSSDLYQECFGMDQPADIWHNSKKRFTDINFQRVNLSKYWLLPKPRISVNNALYALAFATVLLFIRAAELSIIGFLVLLVVVIIIGIYKSRNATTDEKDRQTRENSGCTAGSCSSDYDSGDVGHHHHQSDHSGDSGCSSGCSDSGCSGCGGD